MAITLGWAEQILPTKFVGRIDLIIGCADTSCGTLFFGGWGGVGGTSTYV